MDRGGRGGVGAGRAQLDGKQGGLSAGEEQGHHACLPQPCIRARHPGQQAGQRLGPVRLSARAERGDDFGSFRLPALGTPRSRRILAELWVVDRAAGRRRRRQLRLDCF